MSKRYMAKFLVISIILVMLIPIWGCSKSDSVTAPSGSTITINPSDLTVTDSSETVRTWTAYFTITVTDNNGNPMNDTDVSIFFPWAVPQGTVVQLYDGNTPKNSPFTAKTDENGVYNLRFDYMSGGGLDYFGNLEVRTGSSFTSIEVTVGQ